MSDNVFDDEFMGEMLGEFLDESQGYLSRLNDNLLSLDELVSTLDDGDAAQADMDLLNEMFRDAHSLKGLSAMLQFDDINSVTHRIENVFDAARRDNLGITRELTDLMFQAIDHLTNMVDDLKEPDSNSDPIEYQPVLDQLHQFIESHSGTAATEIESAPESTETAADLPHESAPLSHTSATETIVDRNSATTSSDSNSSESVFASESDFAPDPLQDDSFVVDPESRVHDSGAVNPASIDNAMQNVTNEADIPDKYLAIFIDETEQSLDELSEILDDEAPAEIDPLLVTSHRIKGAASSIGLNRAAKLAHTMEDLLQDRREAGKSITKEISEGLLVAVDALRSSLDIYRAGTEDADEFDEAYSTLKAVQLACESEPDEEPSPFANREPIELANVINDLNDDTAVSGQVVAGLIELEDNIPLAEIKINLIFDRLSSVGKIVHRDPSEQELADGLEPKQVAFGLISETNPDDIRSLVDLDGIRHIGLETFSCEVRQGPVDKKSASKTSHVPAQATPEVATTSTDAAASNESAPEASTQSVSTQPSTIQSNPSRDEPATPSSTATQPPQQDPPAPSQNNSAPLAFTPPAGTIVPAVDATASPAAEPTKTPNASVARATTDDPLPSAPAPSDSEKAKPSNPPADSVSPAPISPAPATSTQASPSATPAAAPVATSPAREPARPATPPPKDKPAETLRVDIERLDQLMNLSGQLVINKAQFTQITEKLKGLSSRKQSVHRLSNATAVLDRILAETNSSRGTSAKSSFDQQLRNHIQQVKDDLAIVDQDIEQLREARTTINDLSEAVHQLDRVADGIQKSVMDTRMVPVGPLFSRFKRVVRDITRTNGKDVQLLIRGEKTELDKRMIDELADPLIHMVRNSADHGIELPKERIAVGKPARGTVTLDAFHRGNRVIVQVQDDGRGLDPDKIRAKAISKNIISQQDAERLSDQQSFQLIWEPGFSTAEKITEVSGRGMGMDIVRSKIEQLNGTVELESELGVGTTITIKLPLTMAILPSLLTVIGGDVFAIPLESVKEIVRVNNREMKTVRGIKTADVRGRIISLVELSELFDWQSPIVRLSKDDSEHTLVIVGSDGDELGLPVDRLLGEEDIVIKSLAENYRNVDGLSGASILGDGRVSLILDVASLVSMACRQQPASETENALAAPPA